MEDKKVLLSIKDLEVKFRVRGRILTAIRGISLDIYENESIAIVGESGSGKSVFTKTFAGMLDSNGFIDKGSIIFNDSELADTHVRLGRVARQTLENVRKKLDAFAKLEPGAATFRQMKELESQRRRKMSVSDEERAGHEAHLKELRFKRAEAFNLRQTMENSSSKAKALGREAVPLLAKTGKNVPQSSLEEGRQRWENVAGVYSVPDPAKVAGQRVLLIDDIQFLGDKESTLEQFFHTFNSLYQNNKRIVIASDVPPKNLKGFESRLISRFEQGLTVDVKPPDLETRIAILRMLVSTNGTYVPNDVLDLIAERFTDNIRELEGALNRVTALASLNNQPVTRILAEQTLQDFFSTDIELKPTDIIGRVAKYFHLTFDDLVGPTRTKNVTIARQIAMYLTRDLTSMSLVNIGQVFGGRDHTTVMHNCKTISEGMKDNPQIYTYVTELTLQLRQRISE